MHKGRKTRDDKKILALCDRVREAGFELHRFLRHGHLEKVYENGLVSRLRKAGVEVQQQYPLKVFDEDGTLLGDYYVDLFVEDLLLVELKACNELAKEHIAQALGYLRASRHRDALLINFGSPKIQFKKLIL
ncbi:MAG: GxxExxY protein [Gammaproteobacteria bacterium]